MIVDLLLLAVGIALLIGGGEFLVRGASSIASGLGVPPVVIGLTVVAFGTSAPELAVNIQAAITGNGDLSFGNIMGSNLANIGLIVGCAAVIRPLEIHAVVVRREIPMMLFATVAALVMTLDPQLRGAAAASLDRVDGILLLVLFAVFLSYTARDVFKARSTREMVGEVREEVKASRTGLAIAIAMTIGGLGGLVAGGRVTVDAAEAIARAFGASDVVIGLTVVAIGTSLPELVTALVATRRGQTDLAIGNVVGSNLFNLLFVLATTVTIAPFDVPARGYEDLAAVLAVSGLLALLTLTGDRRILRKEGALLLVLYASYTAWRTLS